METFHGDFSWRLSKKMKFLETSIIGLGLRLGLRLSLGLRLRLAFHGDFSGRIFMETFHGDFLRK